MTQLDGILYTFENPSIMFAYRGEELSGIFFLHENEEIERHEIFSIFENSVDVIMTVPLEDTEIPEVDIGEEEEVTFDQVLSDLREKSDKIAGVVQRAEMGILRDEECQYQIARVLH